MLLARSKGSPFEAVKEFASRVFIPITKDIIEGNTIMMESGEAMIEFNCKQCGTTFNSQNNLREHIDVTHVL